MYKELKVWGRDFSLEVLFDVFEGEDVLVEQQQALDAFLDKADVLLSDTSAIEKYCIDNSNGEIKDTVDNIFKYVIPTQIYVKRKTDTRQVVLLCNYRFDDESGCALVFENEKLLTICTQEDVEFI